MSVDIEVAGVSYEHPSSAADMNWAAEQVALLQALADAVNEAVPTDVAGTAGSGTGISGADTQYGRNVIHKVTLSYAAVQVAALTKDITLWTLPAKTRVLRVVANVTTKFLGGAISTVTLKSGYSAGGAQYILADDVLTDPIVLGIAPSQFGTSILGGVGFAGDFVDFSSTTAVQCRFTSTVANLSALTQGVVTFYIECCTYP